MSEKLQKEESAQMKLAALRAAKKLLLLSAGYVPRGRVPRDRG